MQTPIGSAIDPNSSKEYSSVEAHKPLIVLLPNMASSGPANDTVENAWSYPQVFDRGGDLRKPIGEIRPVALRLRSARADFACPRWLLELWRLTMNA
jgi:hypothetical protein